MHGLDQSWDLLDALGNWAEFDDDGAAQTRATNEANEIQSISGDLVDPAYDAAGNMTTVPKPDDPTTALTVEYDAWNRVARVKQGATVLAEYEYDATNRRIVERTDFVSDVAQEATHSYLSGQQIIETRDGSPAAAPESLNPKYQNVWSPRYIDALVLRDENQDADGYCDGANDGRLFYLADANYNVTAVVLDGEVVERYDYDPYGRVEYYDASWNDRSSSTYANTTLYTGRTLDLETALYYYRARYYSPQLGGFISRDPIGFKAGDMNLYEYVLGRPTVALDPLGTATVLEPSPIPFDPLPWPPGGGGGGGGVGGGGVGGGGVGSGGVGSGVGATCRCVAKKICTAAGPITIILCNPTSCGYDDEIRLRPRTRLEQCSDTYNDYDFWRKQAGGWTKETDLRKLADKCYALQSELMGRRQYLDLGCDYVLKGSIKRGSEAAERGHRNAVKEKEAAVKNCWARFKRLSGGKEPWQL